MKSFRIYCFSLLAFLSVTTVNANDFEAALSSETAEFTFRSDSSLIGWGGSDLAFSLFFNEDDDLIVINKPPGMVVHPAPGHASGTLVNGDEFGGFREFRTLLTQRKPQFARALTTRLLEYGLGRRLQPTDRPQVDLILQRHRERGAGFRDLIELVVQSELFRRR